MERKNGQCCSMPSYDPYRWKTKELQKITAAKIAKIKATTKIDSFAVNILTIMPDAKHIWMSQNSKTEASATISKYPPPIASPCELGSVLNSNNKYKKEKVRDVNKIINTLFESECIELLYTNYHI